MLDIRLDKREVDKALGKIIRALKHPRPFFKAWANKVARKAGSNARSHSKGGSFWPSIADQVKITEVSDSRAVVACLHFAAAQKEYGGTIRARKAGALTIPISAEARGKRASEFVRGGRRLFVPKGKDVLGYSDGKNFRALFVLRKSVTQDPEPWWPTEADAAKFGLEEGYHYLKKEMGI
jgi:hypothetical protein